MCTGRKRLIILAAVVAASCADPTSVSDQLDPWELGTPGPSLSVIPSLPAVCGGATVIPLIADETVPVGTVEVTQGTDNLYVVYRTDVGWPIRNSAVFVGASTSQIPTNGGGNPRVGKFPYKAEHLGGPNEVVWEVPVTSLSGPEVVVAAFAEVGEAGEGAWGEGEMISPGGSWAMYFMHSTTRCAAETVDASGGSVATPGGEASIQIPAGALTSPTDITIDPSTVQELLDHAQGGQGAAASASVDGAEATGRTTIASLEDFPTLNGTVPIEGTVWDYGPDGLEFATPATVAIRYEDEWIPEGVDEEDLKIFVTNGIFVQPQSAVDPILNTVSAEIDHFSFAYIGFLVEADLGVISATESGDPILVGESVTYQATLENFGPYLFP
ncbi:MAG: hypothetical protein OEO79_13655, partial [Gemmatimonadota bacterium]|nr:hypothetical protein [Gemmatimonadota bacterium]